MYGSSSIQLLISSASWHLEDSHKSLLYPSCCDFTAGLVYLRGAYSNLWYILQHHFDVFVACSSKIFFFPFLRERQSNFCQLAFFLFSVWMILKRNLTQIKSGLPPPFTNNQILVAYVCGRYWRKEKDTCPLLQFKHTVRQSKMLTFFLKTIVIASLLSSKDRGESFLTTCMCNLHSAWGIVDLAKWADHRKNLWPQWGSYAICCGRYRIKSNTIWENKKCVKKTLLLKYYLPWSFVFSGKKWPQFRLLAQNSVWKNKHGTEMGRFF